jgi:hypothetical protein
MPRLPWAAEVTRTSLQSLVRALFGAFCYDLSATHGCDLDIPDASSDIPADTDWMGNAHAKASDLPDIFYGRYRFLCIVSFSMYAFEPSDTACYSNIFAFF